MAIDPVIYGYVSTEESYSDGAYIIKEGAAGDWVYVIIEGRVKVVRNTAKGAVTVAKLKEGQVFGELILLQMEKSLRTASVIAVGDVTVGLLNMKELNRELQSISPLLKTFISSMAKRVQDATQQLISLSTS
jgi:CRP-like cAMP-binding protein